MIFFVFRYQNSVKAHLASYPTIVGLYVSELRYFSVGILFSFNLLNFLVFVYSIRQHFYNTNSSVLPSMLSFIASEALLFAAYCGGLYHFTLCAYPLSMEGVIFASSRKVVLAITLVFAASSCMAMGYHFLVEKGMNFDINNMIVILIITGELFLSMQIFDYVNLSFHINDSVFGTIHHVLLGFHFIHIVVGLLFCIIYFIRRMLMYQVYTNTNTVFQYAYLVYSQSDQIFSTCWIFLEFLWILVKFLLYT